MSVRVRREERGTKMIVDKILEKSDSFTDTSFRDQVIIAAKKMLTELNEYPENLWSVNKLVIDFERGVVESELTSKSSMRVVSNSYSVK
jgi:hypothetical protein